MKSLNTFRIKNKLVTIKMTHFFFFWWNFLSNKCVGNLSMIFPKEYKVLPLHLAETEPHPLFKNNSVFLFAYSQEWILVISRATKALTWFHFKNLLIVGNNSWNSVPLKHLSKKMVYKLLMTLKCNSTDKCFYIFIF